jgi:hypothetical protein
MKSAWLCVLVLVLGACASSSDVGQGADALTSAKASTEDGQDCSLRKEPAFDRGKSFTIEVFMLGAKPVAVSTGNAFLAMQKAAKKAGVNLTLTSGFRTNDEQQRLFDCFQAGQCPVAAPPGSSNHQNGRALDLSVSTWLANNAAEFGFKRTVPSEPWHYEFFGDPPDGPCGAGSKKPADLPPAAPRAEGSVEEGAPPSELDPAIFGDASDRSNCSTDSDCQPDDEDLGFRCIKGRCV